MIEGVVTKRLKVVPDERGHLMECLRNDDDLFIKFGQKYMTTTLPGVVKGWHLHRLQWDNVVCVKGMIKLTLYDAREGSATQGEIGEYFIGEHNPMLVRIPPGTQHRIRATGGRRLVYLSVDCFPGGRPKDEPTWESHVRAMCANNGWDFDKVRR